MYEYSLVEKNAGVDYFVELYDLQLREDREKLAAQLGQFFTDSTLTFSKREDYYNEKADTLTVHLEWYRTITKKVSPYSTELSKTIPKV